MSFLSFSYLLQEYAKASMNINLAPAISVQRKSHWHPDQRCLEHAPSPVIYAILVLDGWGLLNGPAGMDGKPQRGIRRHAATCVILLQRNIAEHPVSCLRGRQIEAHFPKHAWICLVSRRVRSRLNIGVTFCCVVFLAVEDGLGPPCMRSFRHQGWQWPLLF